MDSLKNVSDESLLARVEGLSAKEKLALPDLLAHLAEVDRRGAFRAAGFTSLFDYCMRRLKYSEDEAYRKIHAARAAADHPAIYPLLADGHLSLSVVSKLAPHLTPENATELLQDSVGKAKRDVEEMLAAKFPQTDRPDRIKPLKTSNAVSKTPSDRFEFSFTGSRRLKETLERAKEILSHKLPFGGLEDVLSAVLDEFVQRHERQPLLIDPHPETNPTAQQKKRSRYIPARVRDMVWARDGGRCTFVAVDGTRCLTRRRIQIDHIVPFSRGGRSDDATNLRLLCAAHNDCERRRILGEGLQLELSTNLARAKLIDDASPQ